MATATRQRKRAPKGGTKGAPKRKAAPRRRAPAKRVPVRKRAAPVGPWRPTDLTPETTEAIAARIRAFSSLQDAARSAGVGRSTAYGWMARGRAVQSRIEAQRSEGLEAGPEPEEVRFLDFLDAVEKAEADARVYAAAVIRDKTRSKDQAVALRAAVVYVQSHLPREWSPAQRSEVAVESTSRVEVVLPTEEEQRARTAETWALLAEARVPELAAAAASGEFDDDEEGDGP